MLRVLACLGLEHDYRLVLLAAAVCISGSWIAMRLFARTRATSGSTWLGWLFLTGVATGASIWTTHFIAMLAFEPSMPTSYEPTLTMLSLFIAIGATSVGFAVAASRALEWSAELGGALVGLGIGAMHYVGMAAFRVGGRIAWDPALVVASVAIGAALGALALNRIVHAQRPYWTYGAAALLTLAICGLHFTAMGAVEIVPDPSILIPARTMSSEALSLSVAGVALLVIGTGFSSYLIDNRSRKESQRERRETEKRIRHLAYHDPLTGLANRTAFDQRLDFDLEGAARDNGHVAVLCMDLDRFKEINDVFGHGVGDRALAEVTRRMSVCLHEGDFLARLGGDEFAAIQTTPEQPRDAADLAKRLTEALAGTFEIDGQALQVGVSVGIAVYPADGEDREQLLTNADVAMYRAKADNSRTICFFERGMDEAVRKRRALSQELKAAIERDELELHYQVQKSIRSDNICGFEALLRWHHPVRGLVPPADFIPLAEETRLIIPIGEWVLRAACRTAAAWDRPYKIAVNLSPVQFTQANLPELVHDVLLQTGLSPARLELEITESTLIADPDRTLNVLRRLKALGVTIAMDDFGTGYSSLSTLQAFPFDKIKIDRSFVNKVEEQHQAAAIVRAVLGLGRSLSIPVLAEGVENEGHLAFLRDELCDEVQGYLLGRPAPLAQIAHLVFDRVPEAIVATAELRRAG